MRILIQLCCLLATSALFAESTVPTGCQPIPVQGESVTIKAKKNKLVYIQNLAKTDIWITHPVDEPSASAGWTTRLQTGNWSALAVDKGPFILNCIESRPGHEQQIPCEGTINVCQWSAAAFPEKAQGTFWAAEDMALPALTTAVSHRGFKMPGNKEHAN